MMQESEATFEWAKIGDIKPGDRIMWWTQAVEVLAVARRGNRWAVTFNDPWTAGTTTGDYRISDKLKVVRGPIPTKEELNAAMLRETVVVPVLTGMATAFVLFGLIVGVFWIV
jgi:hypothetical protein